MWDRPPSFELRCALFRVLLVNASEDSVRDDWAHVERSITSTRPVCTLCVIVVTIRTSHVLRPHFNY